MEAEELSLWFPEQARSLLLLATPAFNNNVAKRKLGKLSGITFKAKPRCLTESRGDAWFSRAAIPQARLQGRAASATW